MFSCTPKPHASIERTPGQWVGDMQTTCDETSSKQTQSTTHPMCPICYASCIYTCASCTHLCTLKWSVLLTQTALPGSPMCGPTHMHCFAAPQVIINMNDLRTQCVSSQNMTAQACCPPIQATREAANTPPSRMRGPDSHTDGECCPGNSGASNHTLVHHAPCSIGVCNSPSGPVLDQS